MSVDDPKGDLEVVVNYMGTGLFKSRIKDVKVAEMIIVLDRLFESIIKVALDAEMGRANRKMFKVFGKKQFDAI